MYMVGDMYNRKHGTGGLARLACVVLGALTVFNVQNTFAAQEEEETEKATYIGVDFSFASLSALDQTFSPVTVRTRLGFVALPDMIPTLSFEGHIGFDITDDSNTINGIPVTFRLNNYAAMYARASQQVADIVTVYGLLGYSAVQLKGDTQYLKHDTATGLSFGAGAMFSLPFDIDGYVEAMQLVNGDSFDVYTFSIGVSYKL